MTDRSTPAPTWTIAVDLSPGKVNGDYLLGDDQRSRRSWYESHPKAWALTEVTPTKRGMNTVQDVEDTLLRCARAVKQADPDHTVEDFDVIGVVADMVESHARENERLRPALKQVAADLGHVLAASFAGTVESAAVRRVQGRALAALAFDETEAHRG